MFGSLGRFFDEGLSVWVERGDLAWDAWTAVMAVLTVVIQSRT